MTLKFWADMIEDIKPGDTWKTYRAGTRHAALQMEIPFWFGTVLRRCGILAVFVAMAVSLGCSATPSTVVPHPKPTVVSEVRTVATVVYADAHPVVGAACQLEDVAPYGLHRGTTNQDGYVAWDGVSTGLTATAVHCQEPSHVNLDESAVLKTTTNENLPPFTMVNTLPAPPTRDEILHLHITFQGMYCDTQQFGRLPWFEAALPWLTPEDRARCYAAKHASPAWGPDGDTHALINLPSGPPLYDEPGQPYSADRFPSLDWTAGGTHVDGRLADLIVEVARAGFNRQLLFLGGDDGERGFPIAMHQLDLVHDAIRDSAYGDLGPYVVVLPGWDGVFYGYTPDQVAQWGAKCRSLFVYCGIEHQPGKIPVGEGGGDYLRGHRMSTFDLILAEFAGPNDSTWRAHINGYDSRGNPDYNGNQIWQVAIRMLGSNVYRHPSDQPGDADKYTGGSYLAPESSRGPYVHCAFEWVGEYLFVRDRETAEQVDVDRTYFKNLGYTCGG